MAATVYRRASMSIDPWQNGGYGVEAAVRDMKDRERDPRRREVNCIANARILRDMAESFKSLYGHNDAVSKLYDAVLCLEDEARYLKEAADAADSLGRHLTASSHKEATTACRRCNCRERSTDLGL